METSSQPISRKLTVHKPAALKGAFFWLSAFYFVYCARPEDWIPLLKYLPLAKISGIFAAIGLLSSMGRSRRKFRDLPREWTYLLVMGGLLIVSALLSPVWKGGALFKTLDFTKLFVAWVLTFLVITNFERLRQIIFIQSASVAVVAVVSVLKGRNHPRLGGVLGGIYDNPNDLAFAIVLSLPLCVAFLLNTKKLPRKAAWIVAMLCMCVALFLTASRAGFITLLCCGMVGLWHFGIEGKRPQLVAAAVLTVLIVGVTAGRNLERRFSALSEENISSGLEQSAHGSYEERRRLMILSFQAMEHYPLGIGFGNFPNYSGTWKEVHSSYLQIGAEGGVLALIFYLLFFARGFDNLKKLRRTAELDEQTKLFAAALHTSLIGFVVGSLFAPEAFQFFPYFTVAYTSVLLAIAREKQEDSRYSAELPLRSLSWRRMSVTPTR